MASFFEKLKRGMGVETAEINQKEEKPEEIKSEQETEAEPAPKTRKRGAKKERPEPAATPEEKKRIEPEIQKTEKKEVEAKNKEMEQKNEVKIEKEEKKWPSFNKDQEGQLAIDVYQTEEFLVLQSAIAGVKPDSLDIVIEGDMVAIKGNREKPEEKGDRNYFYQECFWGPFSRQIILSVEVDPSRAEAILKEGILTIRLPKIERDKKRKLVVKG
jgi:HSP20 family molecular chaperone IbpA